MNLILTAWLLVVTFHGPNGHEMRQQFASAEACRFAAKMAVMTRDYRGLQYVSWQKGQFTWESLTDDGTQVTAVCTRK